jgi:light-regulated signal transduction histidine kinase (bacteriophytochrome)
VCNGRDSTAAKAQAELLERSRRELERSNRELAQFASVASHDLSEPLRAINGFSSLLASELGDELSSDARTYLGFILDGTQRIDALLTYARVGRTRQPPTEVDLDAVLSDLLSATLVPEDATVVVEGALGTVVGDASQVGQLLQNLLTNALKFRSGRGHRVEVSAVRDEGEIELRVDDSGVGIQPAQRERVFEMFQRLHTRDEFPGSGMGLAICARIAEHHGGSIRVEGSPLGGARFVVTLPLAPQPRP